MIIVQCTCDDCGRVLGHVSIGARSGNNDITYFNVDSFSSRFAGPSDFGAISPIASMAHHVCPRCERERKALGPAPIGTPFQK